MSLPNCVRCSEPINRPNSAFSHFFIVCDACTVQAPENIFDQFRYHREIHKLSMQIYTRGTHCI